jgi:nitrate/nitrite-specific signal transduction histidine kinase
MRRFARSCGYDIEPVGIRLGYKGLLAADREVVLEVEDDGVGFSPEAVSQPHALGLVGIRERAAIFGGQVEIPGTPGKGTTVIVRIPIDENPGR